MAGRGKGYGEGNVHVARWRVEAAKRTTEELVALYSRLAAPRGRFTQRQLVVRRELENRGLSLRDLGIDPPRGDSHDAAFAEFRAQRDAERAAAVKVTWRKVSPMTGGGWSGLGPDGRLVWIGPRTELGQYPYGDVDGKERRILNVASTVADAKRRLTNLLTEEFTHDAAQPQKEATMATTTTENETITAEQFVGSIEGVEAVRAAKAPTARLRANGKTLAYADDRKGGFLLSIAAEAVEAAPKAVKSKLTDKGRRATMHVTAGNAKGAAAVVAWLAKQVA